MKAITIRVLGLMVVAGLAACAGDEDAVKPEPTAKPVVKKVVPKPLPKADVEPAPAPKPVGEDGYRTEAEALVSAIDGGKDAAEVGEMAKSLTQVGLSLLPALIQKYPECKAYLEAITVVADKLADMPLAEIESGYHSDGKLPETPSANCYHGKDLVVHPATVEALAKLGLTDREQAKGEITEVLGHLGALDAEEQK